MGALIISILSVIGITYCLFQVNIWLGLAYLTYIIGNMFIQYIKLQQLQGVINDTINNNKNNNNSSKGSGT